MTIHQWNLLPNENRIGNFWVIDHQTGWAYWANRLEAGEATSYLLDETKVLDEAIEESVFNGYSYYGINVESDLVSLEQKDEFLQQSIAGLHLRWVKIHFPTIIVLLLSLILVV